MVAVIVVGGDLLRDVSAFARWGAIELGLVYGFVAIGVFLSFRVLDFPDLTVDGSLPLGAGVAAVLLLAGVDPWLAMLAAFAAGSIAGLVTAFLNVRFRILHLLASILTMFALLSVSLRIMGRPNISLLRQETIFTPVETFLQGAAGEINAALDAFQDALFLGYAGFDLNFAGYMMTPLFLAALVVVVVLALNRFLGSNFGLGMRAIGVNKKMAQAQGIRVGANIYVGMGLSNGLVGLAGALFAQSQTFADVTSGQGTIVVGLAAVIVGETILRFRGIWVALVGCVLGSIIYRLALAAALQQEELCVFSVCLGFDLRASDLNLITAVIITLALVLPRLRRGSRV